MEQQARRALRRMKSPHRRAEWRADARVIRMLGSTLARLEENSARLARIEDRGTPRQWQQAFDDLRRAYGLIGQVAEVTRVHTEQIQALVDAYDRLSLSLKQHHESSSTDRAALHELMSEMHLLLGSLAAVARSQVRHLHDIGLAVGADQTEAERRRLMDVSTRDQRPEEK